MIRPASFGFNHQTAVTNVFQNEIHELNASEKARLEFDGMVKKLQRHLIDIKVFEDLRNDLPDSVFSNNWIGHIPDKAVVIFPMFTVNRRNEVRQDIANWIIAETNVSEKIDLSNFVAQDQYLEGTGSIVFDHVNKIAFACESERTNISLFENFCNQIGYKPVSFLSVDLNGVPLYHTNVMLTLGSGYAIVCLDSIENPIERNMVELSLRNTGREILEISQQQIRQFAGNCFEVMNQNEEACLLMSQAAFESFTDQQKEVLERFVKIIWFDIPTIEKIGGGSVRCMLTGVVMP